MYRVLFVCLGNICRSPMAHGVFGAKLAEAGLSGRVVVDSAGTAGWHIGNPPDSRAQAESLRRGYDLSDLRARKIRAADFEEFDMIIAMDHDNLHTLERQAGVGSRAALSLFLSHAPDTGDVEVPDPYYGGDDGFGHALDLIEAASDGLLKAIQLEFETKG